MEFLNGFYLFEEMISLYVTIILTGNIYVNFKNMIWLFQMFAMLYLKLNLISWMKNNYVNVQKFLTFTNWEYDSSHFDAADVGD